MASDHCAVVVVVGGGFAGLTAVRTLKKKFAVILIDAKEYWEYYPGVMQAYIKPEAHAKLHTLYQPMCDALGVTFAWGEVTKVDIEKQCLVYKAMAELKDVTLKFDYLLLTNGSEYGMSMGLKKMSTVAEKCLWYPAFLECTIDETGWGCLDERFIGGRRAHLEAESKAIKDLGGSGGTVVVVGAGYVGVEWATELKYHYPKLNVVLTDKQDCVMGERMPPRCTKAIQNHLDKAGIKCLFETDFKDSLSTDGSEVGAGVAKFLEGHGIYADRIYICTGMRAINQFLPDSILTAKKSSGRGGYISVNSSMQVVTKDGPWGKGVVFAAGNNVLINGMAELPKNANPAEHMAKVACCNIAVEEIAKDPHFPAGCLGMCKPRTLTQLKAKKSFYSQAISLGPKEATFVVGATGHEAGCLCFKGCVGACLKGFIQWVKVDETKGGCMGSLIAKMCM